MSQPNRHLYEFEQLQLDLEQRRLLRNGRRVKFNPKAFTILVLLVENHGRLVTKEQIREKIWPDATEDIGPRLFAQIRSIRKALGKRGKGKNEEYIDTVHGEGYQFIAPVRIVTIPLQEDQESDGDSILPPDLLRSSSGEGQEISVGSTNPNSELGSPIKDYQREIETTAPSQQAAPKRNYRRTLFLTPLLVGLIVAMVFWYHRQEVEAIKRVIQDSQQYENLVMYSDPDAFDEQSLNKYWLDEAQGGTDIRRVKNSLRILRNEGRRYGKEAKVESFGILKVDWPLFSSSAEVTTDESWFLPMYYKDGSLTPRKQNQRWNGTYALRKVNGVWLIHSTQLPRPAPIPPIISPSPSPKQ